MRIISGSHRGHKLIGFEGDSIRPTTDRVKESMFNLITGFVPDAYVLDLFCGSGALSLEAISRGAKKAICIDSDKKSIEIIKKNTESLRFEEYVDMLCMSAMQYLDRATLKFDIIFLDPPYNKGFIEPVVAKIIEKDLLSQDGIIVLESDSTDGHHDIDGLWIYRQRKYGRTYVTIYKKGEKI